MIVTDNNKDFIREMHRVDFLSEQWEKERYVTALMEADAWGKKINEKNKEFREKNRLVSKYRTGCQELAYPGVSL